mmetsp:Transcript_26069/g.61802  ORF Transcript_26069/g.61802 Transcript_26069/m.61802 type:complete len:221 (-) Transcript_26069:676-1338(-)|eukprot:1684874-Rhodomonas_salina.2
MQRRPSRVMPTGFIAQSRTLSPLPDGFDPAQLGTTLFAIASILRTPPAAPASAPAARTRHMIRSYRMRSCGSAQQPGLVIPSKVNPITSSSEGTCAIAAPGGGADAAADAAAAVAVPWTAGQQSTNSGSTLCRFSFSNRTALASPVAASLSSATAGPARFAAGRRHSPHVRVASKLKSPQRHAPPRHARSSAAHSSNCCLRKTSWLRDSRWTVPMVNGGR